MYTQCPDCLSIYKTHLALLKSGHGQLRCGHCGSVFDALPTLVENLPDGFDIGSSQLLPRTEADVAPPVLAMPLFEPIETSFEFKLDEDEIKIRKQAGSDISKPEPEKPRIEPTLDDEWAEFQRHAAKIETPDFRASDALTSRAQRYTSKPSATVPEPRASYSLGAAPSKTLVQAQSDPYSPKLSRDLRAAVPAAAANKPEQNRAEPAMAAEPISNRPPTQSPRSASLWIASSLLLALLLTGQIAYYERRTIVRNEAARPWLEHACKIIGCQLPLRFDPLQLLVLDRDVKPHPAAKGALMISASIKNTAPFAQAYPLVEIKLTDLGGKQVALRRFSPGEYLQDQTAFEAGLPSGASLPIVFEVQDPGREAVNFEFAFLSETAVND